MFVLAMCNKKISAPSITSPVWTTALLRNKVGTRCFIWFFSQLWINLLKLLTLLAFSSALRRSQQGPIASALSERYVCVICCTVVTANPEDGDRLDSFHMLACVPSFAISAPQGGRLRGQHASSRSWHLECKCTLLREMMGYTRWCQVCRATVMWHGM